MTEPHLYLDIFKADPPAAPPPGGGAKGAGGPKIKYEYWGSRPGTPDPQLGWEQTESGKWRRPRGAGGGKAAAGAKKEPKAAVGAKGKGKVKAAKPPTGKQVVESQLASQIPDQKLVSSGSKKRDKVSSPAAKREKAKRRAPQPAEMMGDHPDFQAEPKTESKTKAEPKAEKKPVTEQEKIQQQAKAAIEKEKMLRDAAKKKEAPKAKEAKKPENPQEKLILEHHNEQVKNLKENIKSHLNRNKDLKPDQKEKLKTVMDALEAHGTRKTLPEADHKKLLAVAKQVAGEHGKSKFEPKKVEPQIPSAKKKKEQMARIEAAVGKKAPTDPKSSAMESRLRGKDEPPPLPDKKKQEKMRKEVDKLKKQEATKAEREKKAEENKKAREQAQWDKKIEAAKEQILRNTEAPGTPEGVQEQQAFKNQSKELASNIRAHLESGEVDDEKRSQLENTLQILESHDELTGLPSQEQKKAQAAAKKLAGVHGKPPKEPKGEKEPKEQKKRPIPFGRWARAGYAAGQAAGEAAATPEAAGGIAEAPAYGVRGAAAIGQHLLHNRNVNKENAESKKQSQKTPKKGAEVEQSAMNKSLNLYIDLNKAAQGDTATQPVLTPEHAKRKHEASYQKQPVGVASEGLVRGDKDDDDDEEIEKKFKSKDQQKYMFAAAERGEIPKKVVEEFADKTKDYSKLPEDVDNKKKSIKKSISSGLEDTVKSTFAPSFELLKSINSGIQEEIRKYTPSSLEAEFMVNVLGHDVSAVRKGLCVIKGKDRHRFNEWAAERLSKSISSLQKRIS